MIFGQSALVDANSRYPHLYTYILTYALGGHFQAFRVRWQLAWQVGKLEPEQNLIGDKIGVIMERADDTPLSSRHHINISVEYEDF